MSAFARLLHPLPASRRTYSSFFSSKPGGGRYFNSAKPPKSVVPGSPTSGKSTSKSKVDPSAVSSTSAAEAGNGIQGASGGSSSNGPNRMMKASVDETQSASSPRANSQPQDNESRQGHSAPQLSPSAQLQRLFSTSPPHPMVNAKDFKLHQFFSLHRPLLLLSDPPSILHAAPPVSIFTQPSKPEVDAKKDLLNGLPKQFSLDDSPEASIDADAETARQLSRALTMSRAGATIAWESTLHKLGLDVALDADRVHLQQQLDREWQEVVMDSVQRKRRKKMKKHKLKKRRKATRATRLKIGR